jgi:5'-nucleotidase / UDP-sugar diphosphatase
VVSPEIAPIYKADSNARTVYVLDLFYDPATKELNIQDQLQPMTAAIPADPATLAETNHWMDLAFATLRAAGDEPTRVLGYAPVALDGFETTIRRQRTAFTDLITAGMQQQATNAELAIICSWAVRLDDCIPAGAPVTRYDLMRTFPYGSSPLYAVATPGSLLAEILNFGRQHIGSGSYLLTSPNVTEQAGQWQINQAPLDATRTYVVAMADDLLKDYLFLINAARAAEVTVLGVYGDISQAVINQLQRVTPQHTVAELSQKAGQER